MAVTTPRETWADPRIDDLNKKVDEGFKRMDAGFEKADAKMEAGFKRADARMDAGFARVDSDLRELRRDMKAGFDRLMWGLLCGAGSIIGLLIKAHGL
ncbi:MAG TPA: hypothetical protein VNM38_13055 [Solirubrobacterales bacterium]|nr:hypothetical protein [Solirubrobacterales bacterium]